MLPEIWREMSAVAVLLAVLYAGKKGVWFWGPGVKALTSELSRERDDWRTLAVTLLRKQGVELPEGYEKATHVDLPKSE